MSWTVDFGSIWHGHPEQNTDPLEAWKSPWPVPLHHCRLSEMRRPIMEVERLTEIAIRAPVYVSITRGRPQVIVRVVRIRHAGLVEVRRQHAADQDDVLRCVVGGCIRRGIVRDSIVGDRDTLGTTAVADPHDMVRIDVTIQYASADRRLLVDDGVGVPKVVHDAESGPGTVSFWWLITM